MSTLVLGLVIGVPQAVAAEAPVGLGTAGPYSVLGGQAVTNTGPSTLAGDLGVSPGTAITGFPPGTAAGATHAGDAVAGQAQSDLVVAYDDAAGRAPTANVAGDLVGQTLVGGVYKSTGPLALSGTLTLDGQGTSGTVWIFQVASTLITASSSRVALINGAQACNVFWQVGSSATLGTNSDFVGTIMALTSITVTTGTTVAGRALARNGQVSLDDNTFTTPGCTPNPTTTPGTTGTTTPSPTTDTTTPPPTTDTTTPSTSDTGTTTPSPTTDTTTPAPTTDTTTPPPTTETTTPSTSDTGTTTGSTTSTTSSTGSETIGSETTTTSPAAGLGATWTTTDRNGGSGTQDTVPGGTSNLAGTGASPLLRPLIALGVLLVVLGGLLLTIARRRRARP
ncbi:ice-binding family protein [Amycolatopsis sp. FBCC-B4732]|uniref:ice-binding family protein n=1 Tax=Amycolatopsis sp. FBCC-B4732 TaxID=3079339 RepID=UPI001FF349AB|nr:ice-binding family protein [Amycolatopsis sp. FBCC-B4732]UOX90453.1 ice-binding family protein [Amycolatopsis sp. FBCC-B4732]